MKSALMATALLFAAAPSFANDATQDLSLRIQADYDARLGDLFVHFHENPELSFREFETAKRIASELTAQGFDVTTGVGETGVVAVMRNGDGPTVMIRADMDGLPVKEDSGLSYASTKRQVGIDGVENYVMHACGHDVHVTSLIGTGTQMARLKDDWSGTLILVAQPAEEIISGARAMIKDGLYERFPKPDYALGFHVWSPVEAGKIMVPKGLAYSSSDSVDVTIRGVGTHGAAPHMGVDPVLVASAFVVNLQSIISRTINPLQPGVITVGSFHAGTKNNIIGDSAELKLTVRSDDPGVRQTLLDAIDRVAAGTAKAYGVPDDLMPVVTRLPRNTPPLKNDAETATFLEAKLIEAMGPDAVIPPGRSGMGAEDFAEFIDPEHNIDGVYMAVGGTPVDQLDGVASHHSPFFKVTPEPAITAGTEAMVISAMALFDRG
ncbi:M20 family metallopeptidase [Algimonas porphyrae]|uniref:N-acyl-L-amino acid amidohydrolase n=1 Tax=Algimonas porphyrae TaxID=1128113 RepID=A0ABQ5UXP5_9PROT|nr:amidohydrolase [Algimonas porphyrae]GLQ19328.1 N-acyl-L-amino acid amidohydrolase [Algimonas porphyrae]